MKDVAASVRARLLNLARERKTDLPAGAPTALTPEFYEDDGKLKQWAAFLARTRLDAASLQDVALRISAFLLPVLDALRAAGEFDVAWKPGGPWSPRH